MEFFTIFLSSLLTIASPAGLVLDNIVESKFREQFQEVEQLEIRVDNVPSYQIIQGQAQRLRLASRGVYLFRGFRIDTFELETDVIDVDLSTLQQGGRNNFNQSLNQPLQGGFRIVITEEDVNNLLRSPEIQSRIPEIINRLRGENQQTPSYELLNPQVDFLDNNRLEMRVQFQRLRGNNPEPLNIVLEMGFQSLDGKTIQILNPTGTINERELSSRLLNGFAENIGNRLDLSKLDEKGIMTRLLQLQITNDNFNIAGFARLEDDHE